MKGRYVGTSGVWVAIVLLILVGTLALAGCSNETTQASPSPSTRTMAKWLIPFEPYPPGTASAAEAFRAGKGYAAQAHAETLDDSTLWAEDATLDLYMADIHDRGAEAIAGHMAAVEEMGFHFPKPRVLVATEGAAVVEWLQTLKGGIANITLEVICVSDGKIEHVEVYGDAGRVAKPVASKPGPLDDAAATEAVASAYFAVLADGDVRAATALYAPQVVFQDAVGKPGGLPEVTGWHTKLLAVPNLMFEPRSIIAGDGWAVARWVLVGDDSTGELRVVFGATMFEVRGGKIVRQAQYYVNADSPLGG